MNWTKISAIAEMISSAAILVTLVYLAVQTQQNTAALRASVQQATLDTDMQLLLNRLDNPDRGQLWCKPILTQPEKAELNNDLFALVRTREFEWLQYHNGVLDEDTWLSYRAVLGANLSRNERARAWWRGASEQFFDRRFAVEMNTYLADIPVNDDDCAVRLIE